MENHQKSINELKNDISKINEYLKTHKQSTEKITKQVDQRVNEFQAQSKDINERINQALFSEREKMRNIKEEFDSRINLLKNSEVKLIQSLIRAEQLNKKIIQKQDRIEKQFALKSEVDKNIYIFKTRLDEMENTHEFRKLPFLFEERQKGFLITIENQTNTKLLEYENKFEISMNSFSEKISEKNEEFSKKIADLESKLEQNYKQLEDKVSCPRQIFLTLDNPNENEINIKGENIITSSLSNNYIYSQSNQGNDFNLNLNKFGDPSSQYFHNKENSSQSQYLTSSNEWSKNPSETTSLVNKDANFKSGENQNQSYLNLEIKSIQYQETNKSEKQLEAKFENEAKILDSNKSTEAKKGPFK